MQLLPGVAAALAVMLAGSWLADGLGHALLSLQGLSGTSPVSGVPVAIVVGLLLRNLTPLPDALAPGLRFAATTILRAGIVLVGVRLSLLDVVTVGMTGLPVVVAAIAAGLLFVTWFNRRLGLPPRLGTLVAAGTSICGVTAIVSTAPAIEADEREVAYAVANVVAFGLLGMLLYPYLAHLFVMRSETIGLFLGTAVHDTSQVVGAALTYSQLYGDDVVLRTATVTKLTRNLFLAVVIPVLTWMHRRGADGSGTGPSGLTALPSQESRSRVPRPSASTGFWSWTRYIPAFVVGFVGMAVVRSLGDAMVAGGSMAYGLFDAADWKAVTDLVGDRLASRVLLGTAMAGVGLSTSFTVFRGIGVRPFLVGLAGALVVGGVGLLTALLVS